MKKEWIKETHFYIPYELQKLVSLLKWEMFLLTLGIFFLGSSFVIEHLISRNSINQVPALVDWISGSFGLSYVKDHSDLFTIVLAFTFFPVFIFLVNKRIIYLIERTLRGSLQWFIAQFYVFFLLGISLFLFLIFSSLDHFFIAASFVFIVFILISLSVIKGLLYRKVKETSILWNRPLKSDFKKYISFGNTVNIWVNSIIKYPFFFLIFFIHLTIILSWFSSELELKSNLINLLHKNDPSIQALNQYQKSFGGLGHLILTVEIDQTKNELDNNLIDAKQFVDDLVVRLEKLPEVLYCNYKKPVAFIKNHSVLFSDIGDLALVYAQIKMKLKNLNASNMINVESSINKFRKSKYHNSYSNEESYFLSNNHKMLIILIKPSKGFLDIDFCKRLLNEVEQAVEITKEQLRRKNQSHTLINVSYGGKYKQKIESNTLIKKEFKKITFFGFLFIFGMIALYFRSLSALLYIIFPLFISVTLTFGVTYIYFSYVNIYTGLLIVILIGLGLNLGIHYLSRYFEERQRGISTDESIYIMISETGKQTLTSGFIILSFFFILFLTDFKGFKELGFIGMFGFIINYFVLPFVISILIIIAEKVKSLFDRVVFKYDAKIIYISIIALLGLLFIANSYFIYKYFVQHITNSIYFVPIYYFIFPYILILQGVIYLINLIRENVLLNFSLENLFKRPTLILIITTGVLLLSIIASTKIDFDPSIRKLEGINLDSYLVKDKIKKLYDKTFTHSIILANNEEEEKEIYKTLQYALKSKRKLSTIKFVDAFTAYLPEHQEEKLILVNEIKKLIQEFKDKIKKDKLLNNPKVQKIKSQLLDWEKNNLDKVHIINHKSIPENITRQFKRYPREVGSLKEPPNPYSVIHVFPINDLDGNIEKIQEYAKEIRNIKIKNKNILATGENLILAEILYLIEKNTVFLAISLFVLTIFILIITFKNFKKVFTVFIPLLGGIPFLFGFLFIFDVQFNILNIVLLPIIIGISVDSVVYIYNRYQEEGIGSVFTVLRSIGVTVIFVLLTMTLGFSAFILTSHKGLASIGWFIMLGMGSIFLLAVVFLPTILLLLEKGSSKLFNLENFKMKLRRIKYRF